MNKQLTKLCDISEKENRMIVGLMSGTSLDGLDVALCRFTGSGNETSIETLHFDVWEYSPEMRVRLKSIQSKPETNTLRLTRLHSELGLLYGKVILECLEKWEVDPQDVDLIGSHGQTIFHDPAKQEGDFSSTFQIVDGDHIARATGIVTISDFRQKHTAAGGEGAPLAAIFDECLFRSEDTHRLLLNIGGIANLTWLPSKESGMQAVFGDTGPGNTLINEAMQKYFSKAYDHSGKVAESGTVHSELVRYVLLEPYFRRPFPKTTGQESFKLEFIEDIMEGHGIELDKEDLIATLTAITSQSISRAVEEVAGEEHFELYISGGGIYNRAITDDLNSRIDHVELRNLKHFGISADAKEAVMMAFFANELVAGDGFNIPGITEDKVQLGKISFP